jgi:hypothetical protein
MDNDERPLKKNFFFFFKISAKFKIETKNSNFKKENFTK